MKPATFRGGPLDGERHKVPTYGPAWCRVHHWIDDVENVSFYAHKRGTKRTYTFVSTWDGVGGRLSQEIEDGLSGSFGVRRHDHVDGPTLDDAIQTDGLVPVLQGAGLHGRFES